MSHGHAHGGGPDPLRLGRGTRTAVLVLIGVATVAALIGVWHWWPDQRRVQHVEGLVPIVAKGVEVVHADLTRVRISCSTERPPAGCGRSSARLLDGKDAGRTVPVALSTDVVGTGLRPGDRVLLLDEGGSFAFFRDDRGTALLWPALLFGVLVVLVARWRGVRALVSLAVAAVVVVGFLLPAVLSGRPPVGVALAAATLLLVIMLFTTHGLSVRTAVAVLGALLGLAVSAAGAWLGVVGARLGGLGDESAGLLTFNVPGLDVQQLVVASVVLAGIGTLNDVTITQVSALWELREASPDLPARDLFTRAMRIGRDHVASTVYTLVFAYLGTSLVLLVATRLYGGTPIDFLTAEDVAQEVVRTLVGGIALLLAMPITTAIGALVLTGAEHRTLTRA